MKLRTLSLAGVGSFADELQVDFEGLTQAGLFLIEGPTGSGKSTILDAIVFALYGSVAGTASDAGRVNSHMRTESPFVELTFEVAQKVYVVRRSPAHRRVKRRGTGETEVPATATLLQVGPDGPEGLANRASDVAEHVYQIVGLTKQQFVSTVVLAQGEFATFLDAGTAERAQILERVFGTEFYKRVEDQLHVMRQTARKRRAGAADYLSEAVHECVGVLDAHIDDDDPVTAIDAVLDQLRTDLAQASVNAQSVELALTQALVALQAGEKLVEDQDNKRAALVKQSELVESRQEIVLCREQVRAHERATPVGPAIGAWSVAVSDAQAADAHLREALRILEELGEGAEPDPARLQEVNDLLAQLHRPGELERMLPSRQTALDGRIAQAVAAESASRVAQQKQQAADNEVQSTTARLQDYPDVADRISELTAAQARLITQQLLWDDFAVKRAAWKTSSDRAIGARDLAREAEKALETAEQVQSRDRAVALASTLEAGQPCLVCGSVEHPDPAKPAAEMPAGDIEQLRRCAQQRRKDADEAGGAAAKREGILQHLESQCAGRDLDQDITDLTKCTAEITHLRARKAERGSLQRQLADVSALRMAATDEVTAATLTEQRLLGEARVEREALLVDEKVVVQARAEHPTVTARVKDLGAVRDALRAVAEAQSHARQCSITQDSAKSVLDQTLSSVGFTGVAAAQDAILDDAQYSTLQTRVERWDSHSAETAATLRELEPVDLEVAVDLEMHRTAVNTARGLSREADGRVRLVAERLERGVPSRDKVQRRVTDLETARDQTEQLIRMADYATAARNEVTHKIRLSSFVLMRRFEDVVNAANDRLDTISEGRYQLVVETHGLDARSQAGLDLLIYDGRSDSRRSTKSLSGGERFYVSLALALGLADVVRSESGGVELGTLFIDEGFGSLDSEVLEEVMDMLEQVRVGEDRVIGLISHVEALKQRIDPRISVRRDPLRPGVSTARVHL